MRIYYSQQLHSLNYSPFLDNFHTNLSWFLDSPNWANQGTTLPKNIFAPAFYIPEIDEVFQHYKISCNPLFCDIIPTHFLMVRDKASRI